MHCETIQMILIDFTYFYRAVETEAGTHGEAGTIAESEAEM